MSRRKADASRLEEAIGHRFADRTLLDRALTHVSTHSGALAAGADYQRLEFLGDRVLGLAVADMLYRAFPAAPEGDLSRRLGHLVRRETCAEVALAWDAGPHIRVGGGEAALRRKPAILADVCEAIIAAVYLDGGFAAAQACVERAFGPKMSEPGRATRDPKSMLQEWALGLGRPIPVYRETGRSGPDHAPVFQVTAEVEGVAPCAGEGRSKRQAEMAAAEGLLRREGVMGDEQA